MVNIHFYQKFNGHCILFDQYSYNTLHISDAIITINKFVQIIMFLTYLVYFYKLKMTFRDEPNFVWYNRIFFRVAIAMGATGGPGYFIWLILLAFNSQYSHIISISGPILFLIEQLVIMTFFMCTTKMSEFCKAYFSRD